MVLPRSRVESERLSWKTQFLTAKVRNLSLGLFSLYSVRCGISKIHSTWRRTGKNGESRKKSEEAKSAVQGFEEMSRGDFTEHVLL